MIPRPAVHIRVDDVNAAQALYGALLGTSGERTASGEHTFRSGDLVLVCFEPGSDGYYRVQITSAPLEILVANAEAAYGIIQEQGIDILMPLQWQQWGEFSFYAIDRWGNSMNVIQADTYTGDDGAALSN